MTNKQLLEITTCALKGEKYNKQLENEREMLIQAQENGLLPLLYTGIEEGLLKEHNYKELSKRFFSNVYLDKVQGELVEIISDIFNKNKIKHIFLKGTHLKKIYQETYLRPMGDIDVVILKKDSKKTRKILKKEGFLLLDRGSEHDVYKYKNLIVEVHRYIYKVEKRNDSTIFLKPWDYTILVKDYEYRLNYTFEGLYLLYHLKKHVFFSGIGLRSILDITIFFNYYKEEINKDFFYKELKENNLDQFFQTILYLNKKAFELDSLFLNKDFNLKEEDYLEILNYVTKSGVHGKGKDFNIMAPRLVKKGKFKSFLRILFPNWKTMKEGYPWLRYLPFLLPVAYILRGFKFLFTKTKYTFKNLKNIKKADDEVKDLNETIKKMGL